jgi:hypothetical protein
LIALNTPTVDRDLLVAALLVLVVAEARVERDGRPAQVGDRVCEGGAHQWALGVQPAGGVDRVGRVEGHVERRRHGRQRRGRRVRQRARGEAPEQQRAARVEVVVQVPRGQHRAGLRDVDRAARPEQHRRLLAHGDQLVAPQLARVLAVVEDRIRQLAERELPAVLHDPEAEPLAQRSRRALVPDHAAEALEPLLVV